MDVFYMPTRVVCGRGCVRESGKALRSLGRHALIVTGKSSAFNGALEDMRFALEANGQEYTVFDRVTPNPTVSCVREGLSLLRSVGADFVVGMGGGSPMDAAKAIATLAVQERADEEIFAGGYLPEALPMAHVPTTAGTGSEVTPYAILTNELKQTKTSITSPAMFPKIAFLDGSYTDGLSEEITRNTATDAFSHAAEGLLSRDSTPLSDALACECLRILFPLLKKLAAGIPTPTERDELLYASMLAGMTIAQSGTTAVHGMGYYLTYFYHIDHGRANGLLLGETLRLCERKHTPKLEPILSSCGESVEGICVLLSALVGKKEEIPRETLERFAEMAKTNKNIRKSLYEPSEEELRAIYLNSFGYSV